MSQPLLPLFLKLTGRRVLLVGGGRVAAGKLAALRDAGAEVTLVAPQVLPELEQPGVVIHRRPFEPSDLDGCWLAVSAAPGPVNRQVAAEAEARRIFVNAVDDVACASAYTGGVVRRAGMTVAISTEGQAPALAGLFREGLQALLPSESELGAWALLAQQERQRWRREGLPMAQRRPALLEALVALYEASPQGPAAPKLPTAGFVSLVGAGPGDPNLLTVAAVDRLRRADLVLYDALVAPEALAHAPNAHRFFVGKRAGRPALAQQTIERLLVRAARRGQRVVRLKCGDPFVLGRGGEEALALARAGVPFEVVPGVTSAVAAPALAGIPVTQRGIASGFCVLSGHAEEATARVLDGVVPHAMTVVVLMGLGARARIAEQLLRRGWGPQTPAALCLAASTDRAQTWLGTLQELAQVSLPPEAEGAPGTLVVGEVVSVASQLARLAVPPADPISASGQATSAAVVPLPTSTPR